MLWYGSNNHVHICVLVCACFFITTRLLFSDVIF